MIKNFIKIIETLQNFRTFILVAIDTFLFVASMYIGIFLRTSMNDVKYKISYIF